ncbi:MAG: pyridoxine 5'-phosphate oxidase C-terminal domain-containing protein [Cyanobacteria bacterium P01_A01_bin.37]
MPHQIEFWQGRLNRRHDRFLYGRHSNATEGDKLKLTYCAYFGGCPPLKVGDNHAI